MACQATKFTLEEISHSNTDRLRPVGINALIDENFYHFVVGFRKVYRYKPNFYYLECIV